MKHRRHQRGMGLLEPLIAIAILSFGILGLARYQASMVSQTTDSQARAMATMLSEDLLTQVRVDLDNAACYTRPASGTCPSEFALAQAQAWEGRAKTALPGFVAATASMPDATKFRVTLQWTSKAFKDAAGVFDTRTHEVTTDVRP